MHGCAAPVTAPATAPRPTIPASERAPPTIGPPIRFTGFAIAPLISPTVCSVLFAGVGVIESTPRLISVSTSCSCGSCPSAPPTALIAAFTGLATSPTASATPWPTARAARPTWRPRLSTVHGDDWARRPPLPARRQRSEQVIIADAGQLLRRRRIRSARDRCRDGIPDTCQHAGLRSSGRTALGSLRALHSLHRAEKLADVLRILSIAGRLQCRCISIHVGTGANCARILPRDQAGIVRCEIARAGIGTICVGAARHVVSRRHTAARQIFDVAEVVRARNHRLAPTSLMPHCASSTFRSTPSCLPTVSATPPYCAANDAGEYDVGLMEPIS